MAAANTFPVNFPNGPIVDPHTGNMAPGPNGRFFLLALFNRTGGPHGVMPAPTVQPVEGLTIAATRGMPVTQVTTRQPVDGITIDMVTP